MKKTRLTAALLAATIMVSYAPVQAEEPRERLRAVKKQLDESLDRFKCCMRGKCTREEKIKVARDVGIAALAVVGIATAAYFAQKAGRGRPAVPYGITPDQQYDLAAVTKVFSSGDRVRAYVLPGEGSLQVDGTVISHLFKRDTQAIWLLIEKDDGDKQMVQAVLPKWSTWYHFVSSFWGVAWFLFSLYVSPLFLLNVVCITT